MTLNLLLSVPDRLFEDHFAALTAELAKHHIAATLTKDAAPEEVDYIIYAPHDGLSDFTPYTRAKAVLSLWAGVEKIVGNDTLTQPLCRMVDSGLKLGMRDWVVGHVLRHHLGMDRHIHGLDGLWDQTAPPLAGERAVTILGLGELGATCAAALRDLGFQVSGWSRTPKEVEGITCHHGAQGLTDALSCAEILVLLLPNTAGTRGVMNAQTLAQLPKGAVILNPGRGPLIDDDALLDALERGHIGHATLDVFHTEPLPKAHPYWAHPHVTVTPHIAAISRPNLAAEVIIENIKRGESGQPFLHQVDRTRGY